MFTTDSLLSAPVIEWVGPRGMVIPTQPLTGQDSCVNSTAYASEGLVSGNTSTVELHFPCLSTSQSGDYLCRAISSLPLIGLTQTTVAMETLAVKCKLKIHVPKDNILVLFNSIVAATIELNS